VTPDARPDPHARQEEGEIRRYRLLGLTLETSFRFATPLPPSPHPPDLRFSLEAGGPLPPGVTPSKPDFESPIRIESGAPLVALYRAPDEDRLSFPEVADFQVGDRTIRCRLLDPEYAYMVEIHLLGVVLSYWLERRGIPVLHASAVSVDDRAVGFMATNRGGKSSLAISLVERGHPLLSDDLLGLQEAGSGWETRPGFPSMRMWPDLAERVMGAGWEALPLAHPRFSKRRVPVGAGGFGRFLDRSQPLACLYLPERQDPGEIGEDGPAVRVETLPPAQAVMELIRGSFLLRIPQAAGFAPNRLRLFSDLVGRVPVRRLVYPSGFGLLPEVTDRILEDLRGTPAAADQDAP
jgi:hypothetical protein